MITPEQQELFIYGVRGFLTRIKTENPKEGIFVVSTMHFGDLVIDTNIQKLPKSQFYLSMRFKEPEKASPLTRNTTGEYVFSINMKPIKVGTAIAGAVYAVSVGLMSQDIEQARKELIEQINIQNQIKYN